MKRVIIMSPVPTIIILPSGGWTSKKNILLMYKEPILPKCVLSQQTQAGWSTRLLPFFGSIFPQYFIAYVA